MPKKILVALDDSENAMRAVNFVSRYFAPDSEVTLFHVFQDTQSLCSLQSPELIPYFLEQQSAFCSLENKKREIMDTSMERAKNALIGCGFESSQVHVKPATAEQGIARDIIAEARNGHYEVVVLGKKGHSGIKEFFLGSVTQKVINGVKNASVLMVD